MNSLLPFSIIMFSVLTASAQILPLLHPFDRDLKGLQKGLEMGKFSKTQLNQYLNPFLGKSQFLLPEDRAPWAGNYMAMAYGGLGNRWRSEGSLINSDETLNLPTKEQIMAMSAKEIAQLSPIEKYDIYKGDYSFSATMLEVTQRGPLRPWPVAIWEGFCNGLRCAGIHLPEPRNTIQVTNPDGIPLDFQPADLKALAGASYFFVEKYSQMGSPTHSETELGTDRPNPAIFDLALRYFIGEKQKSFVIDSNLGPEIWNESVVGFKRHIVGPVALSAEEQIQFPGASSKATIQTTLFSLSEISIKRSNRPTTAKVAAGELHKKMKMEYTLFLDSERKAIDGVWSDAKGLRGVDFIWFSGGKGTDAQYPTQNGNPKLDFKVVKELVGLSHKPVICNKAMLR